MVAAAMAHPCERLLVINDNEDMLLTMKDVLELEGVTVQTATSQAEAWSLLQAGFRPTVLLADLRLGSGERGDDFARQLRTDPRTSGIAIVLMSGDVHELRRLAGHTVDATVSKPFDVKVLLELLAEVCGRRGPSPTLAP